MRIWALVLLCAFIGQGLFADELPWVKTKEKRYRELVKEVSRLPVDERYEALKRVKKRYAEWMEALAFVDKPAPRADLSSIDYAKLEAKPVAWPKALEGKGKIAWRERPPIVHWFPFYGKSLKERRGRQIDKKLESKIQEFKLSPSPGEIPRRKRGSFFLKPYTPDPMLQFTQQITYSKSRYLRLYPPASLNGKNWNLWRRSEGKVWKQGIRKGAGADPIHALQSSIRLVEYLFVPEDHKPSKEAKPNYRMIVDTLVPIIERFETSVSSKQMAIRWKVSDQNLGDTPVGFRVYGENKLTYIVKTNMPAEGEYVIDERIRPQAIKEIFFEVVDAAGHRSERTKNF